MRPTNVCDMRPKVLLGGTFGPIHDGHRHLIENALLIGDTTVGVTSDELAQETRDEPRPIPDAVDRMEAVRSEANKYADRYNSDFVVNELNNPVEMAIEATDHTHIVASPEPKTQERCNHINDERRSRGYDPLVIVTVPPIFAEDGGRISSTRIVNGEIDQHGEILDEE